MFLTSWHWCHLKIKWTISQAIIVWQALGELSVYLFLQLVWGTQLLLEFCWDIWEILVLLVGRWIPLVVSLSHAEAHVCVFVDVILIKSVFLALSQMISSPEWQAQMEMSSSELMYIWEGSSGEEATSVNYQQRW